MATYQRCRFSRREPASPRSRAAWRCSAAASQVALLTQCVGEADVQVAGHRERDVRASASRGQRSLVEAPGLGGAAAGQPHLRQDDGGAELVGQVPGRMQAAHRSGERLDRGVEVAAGPQGQAEEPGPGAAGRWSSGPARSQDTPRLLRRTGDVTAGLGDRGAVHRDRHGQLPQLVVGGPRLGRQRRQGSFGGAQPSVRVVHVAIAEPAPRGDDVEDRAAAYDVVRQPSDPAPEGPVLPLPAGLGQGALDEVRRVLDVVAGDRVCDRVIGAAVFGVPPSRRAVQTLHTVGLLAGEPGPQRVGEEVVVAVPPPLLIEGNDEQVGALEDREHVVSVVPAGERVAQRAGQLAEDRRVEQEGAHLFGDWLFRTSSTR